MTHPITPPPELVQQWFKQAHESADPELTFISTAAAQWGADQELKACCEWLVFETPEPYINALRAARRPNPPSLKEQALEALNQADEGLNESAWQQRSDTIRRALEALPND